MAHKNSCIHMCDTHTERFSSRCGGIPQEAFLEKHRAAWQLPNAPERAIRTLITGLAQLCDAHENRFGSPIGEDGYAGVYATDIAKALNALLSGVETGRFDCAMLNSLINAIAERAHIDQEG